jgi:hypothetical protein
MRIEIHRSPGGYEVREVKASDQYLALVSDVPFQEARRVGVGQSSYLGWPLINCVVEIMPASAGCRTAQLARLV